MPILSVPPPSLLYVAVAALLFLHSLLLLLLAAVVVVFVDADPTGPNVLRSPGGTILFVFNDFLNASSIETDGIDLDVKYTFDTNVGTFSPFFNATEVFNYDIEDPQAGFIEGAGNRNFTNFGSPTPETRLTAGIGYATNGVSARLAYRSVSSFIDDQNDGDIIGSFDTVISRRSRSRVWYSGDFTDSEYGKVSS